ncbi:prealbumin-like fold domain-containing protein, partial [uncultured Bifidobacterium sp.]|uniref:prealbumin-like fold domain-containing protein n=1 Tax=uncultured Bifidobacterium sp. TaxID=165187 RepID=UPI00260A2C2F
SDLTKRITDKSARFQILKSDKSTVAVDDVAVVDGFLRVKNANGDWVAPTVNTAGTYWVKEVTAPSGYEISDDLTQVTVGDDQPIGSATVSGSWKLIQRKRDHVEDGGSGMDPSGHGVGLDGSRAVRSHHRRAAVRCSGTCTHRNAEPRSTPCRALSREEISWKGDDAEQ